MGGCGESEGADSGMEEALGGSTFDRQLRALAFPGLQDLHQQPLWARSSAATTSAFVDPSAAALFGALGPHSLHAALNGGGSGGAAAAGGKVSPTPKPWAPLVVQQQLQQGVPAAAPVQPVALCVQPVELQAQPSPGMLKDPQGSKVRRLHHCVLCPIHLWLLLCSSAAGASGIYACPAPPSPASLPPILAALQSVGNGSGGAGGGGGNSGQDQEQAPADADNHAPPPGTAAGVEAGGKADQEQALAGEGSGSNPTGNGGSLNGSVQATGSEHRNLQGGWDAGEAGGGAAILPAPTPVYSFHQCCHTSGAAKQQNPSFPPLAFLFVRGAPLLTKYLLLALPPYLPSGQAKGSCKGVSSKLQLPPAAPPPRATSGATPNGHSGRGSNEKDGSGGVEGADAGQGAAAGAGGAASTAHLKRGGAKASGTAQQQHGHPALPASRPPLPSSGPHGSGSNPSGTANGANGSGGGANDGSGGTPPSGGNGSGGNGSGGNGHSVIRGATAAAAPGTAPTSQGVAAADPQAASGSGDDGSQGKQAMSKLTEQPGERDQEESAPGHPAGLQHSAGGSGTSAAASLQMAAALLQQHHQQLGVQQGGEQATALQAAMQALQSVSANSSPLSRSRCRALWRLPVFAGQHVCHGPSISPALLAETDNALHPACLAVHRRGCSSSSCSSPTLKTCRPPSPHSWTSRPAGWARPLQELRHRAAWGPHSRQACLGWRR